MSNANSDLNPNFLYHHQPHKSFIWVWVGCYGLQNNLNLSSLALPNESCSSVCAWEREKTQLWPCWRLVVPAAGDTNPEVAMSRERCSASAVFRRWRHPLYRLLYDSHTLDFEGERPKMRDWFVSPHSFAPILQRGFSSCIVGLPRPRSMLM